MLDISDQFANFPELETERCILRAISPEDIHDAFEYMSDDRVTQYLPWDTVSTLDEAQKRLQKYLTVFDEQTGITWGIINKANNKMMGIFLLWHFSLSHFRAEIGYVLGSDWWQQGFMAEVASAVLDYGFHEIKFHSMEAHIAPENIGSQRLLEKLGFIQEGYFRENYYDKNLDEFTDTAVFSLLKSTRVK
jgi:[ribosomal protein S5]-alanine N-acetyltransferase